MTNSFKKFRVGDRSPLTIIELIISVMTIIGGLYIFTPALVINLEVAQLASLAHIVTSQIALFALGGIAVCSGVTTIVGILKRSYRLRSAGLFINIMIRLYALLATILIQGFFPMSWLSSLTILLIAVVCYLVVRQFIYIQRAAK